MHVLSIDFDGVVHRASEPGELTIATAGFADLGEGHPDLFGWAHHLEEVLRGHDVRIVLHSPWRAYIVDADLRALLPDGLCRRFVGVSPRGLLRDASIAAYVRAARLAEDAYAVLNDEPDRCGVHRWLTACDCRLGISDPVVEARLRD